MTAPVSPDGTPHPERCDTASLPLDFQDLAAKLERLRANLANAILGKASVIEDVLAGILAGGSILIEDVPGVGKTTLAKAFAYSVEGEFQRIQCTPDLLPADVLGFSVLNSQSGTFHFRKGPVFCNVLLVDEINRASPRTQSALLEAMAEHQVTIEGTCYSLPRPFIVLATQNPVSFQGTFPLPEAQLDRFIIQVSMDYPDMESEIDILYHRAEQQSAELEHVISLEELVGCQECVRNVQVERSVSGYLIELVRQTREHPQLRLGASPRGSQMLFRVAQAIAFLNQRDYVMPDDIQRAAPLVLPHRIVEVQSRNTTATRRDLVKELLEQIHVPV